MVTVMTRLFDVSLISVYITRSMGAIIYLLGGGYFYTRTHARLGIRLYPGGGGIGGGTQLKSCKLQIDVVTLVSIYTYICIYVYRCYSICP